MQNHNAAKISVIIPTWRRGDLLRECLESLSRQTFRDFETIIVSNAAGEWASALAEEFRCYLVGLRFNGGFAAGVNAGVAAACSSYVAVLNDDVQLSPDWLRYLNAILDERADIAFCAGKIYQPDGRIDNAGDAISWGGLAWRLGFGRSDSEEFNNPRPLLAISGTAALFRKSVFDALGGFDERFISYLEDVDLSLRAAKAGYHGIYVPQALCRHKGSASSGGQDSPEALRLLTRNQLLLLVKDFPATLLVRLAPRIVWAQLLWALLVCRRAGPLTYLRGIGGFLRALPGSLSARLRWSRKEKDRLRSLLREGERQIYQDVMAVDRPRTSGFWRAYFLFSSAAKNRNPSTSPDLGSLPAR